MRISTIVSLEGHAFSKIHRSRIVPSIKFVIFHDEEVAWWHVAGIGCESIPFDDQQARIAGGLVKVTRPLGLSLGARACLALAIHRQAEVYTTDKAWSGLSLGIDIHVIR